MRNLTFWISAILVIVFLWAIALTVKKNRENEYNMEQTRKAINHQKQEWAKRGIDYDEVKGMTQKELEEYRMRLILDSLFDKEPLLLPPIKLKKSIN